MGFLETLQQPPPLTQCKISEQFVQW